MDQERKVLLAASAILVLVSGLLLLPLAGTLLFAATLSVVLTPYLSALEERVWPEGAPGRWGSLLALLFTVVSVVAVLLTTALVVFVFVTNFEVMEQFGTEVAGKIEEVALRAFGTPVDLRAQAGESMNQLLRYVQGTFVAAVGVLVQVIVFASLLFLFLRHGRRLRWAVRSLLPATERELFDHLGRVTYSSLYAIYVVHLATALLTVLLALPFFHLIGYGDHLLFWSVLCGIFQLIPVLGPSLIMVAIAIYAFAQGEISTALLVLGVGYPVVAGFPDLVFRPLLLRRGMRIEAAILILGFFAGIVAMGAIGFVIGPLVLKLLVEVLRRTWDSLETSAA